MTLLDELETAEACGDGNSPDEAGGATTCAIRGGGARGGATGTGSDARASTTATAAGGIEA